MTTEEFLKLTRDDLEKLKFVLDSNGDVAIRIVADSGMQTFLTLTDTPASYAGQALKSVRVNAGETGLEFSTAGSGDVVGPGVSVNNNVAFFDGITGKLIKDSGLTLSGSNTGDETTATIKTKLGASSTSTDGYLTSVDWNTFNGKQNAIGYTPEDQANKSTNTALGTSDTLYPTQNAVKTYADSLVAGLLDYRGGYDASSNLFPATGGSGTAGAVVKGDMWIISVIGTLGGQAVQVGDSIIASVDTPGQTAGNWNILNANISYVPEDVANKSTNVNADQASDTKYPSVKAVYDWAVGLFATITGIQTLTNKTIDLTDNTLVGTTAEFNTALSDGDFATLAGTESLTNKTFNIASNTLTETGAGGGDLIKSNGAVYSKFTRGTALQQIRVNAGGTDLEYFTPSASGGSDPIYEVQIAGEQSVGLVARYVAKGAQTIAGVKIALGVLPTGANFTVDVRRNGTATTNSIFTSDTPISITTGQGATNGIYITTGTSIDNGTLAENDVLYVYITVVGSTLSGADFECVIY